jgi:hypothetical protein
MVRHGAEFFVPQTRPDLTILIEDCIQHLVQDMEEPFDLDVLLSRDNDRINTYMRTWIEQQMDTHPQQFVGLLKAHLMDELVYRLGARASFDQGSSIFKA